MSKTMKLLRNIDYEEKKSKFIVYLYEIDNQEEFKSIYKQLKEEHKKARHILRVGRFKNNYSIYIEEASDDKEPVSSMKKAASYLENNDIKDRAVFIVRYFGGTKFGASYLDKVYSNLFFKIINEN